MNPAPEKDFSVVIKTLSQSNDYYSSVFKKTERIVSVLFYILSFVDNTPRVRVHEEQLTTRGLALYETALASLLWPESAGKERLPTLVQAVVAFLGSVRFAEGARVLSPELAHQLSSELDLILRYVRNHYLDRSDSGLYSATEVTSPARRAATPATPRPVRSAPSRSAIPPGDISSDAHLVYASLTDRASRITTVLEAKPEATIKDIAEVITDVSEKTIQRELNSLIEKGQVIRQGERRWSKYSMARSS